MGPPVRYIPKTHEYYRRLGYAIPYKYARFDTTPFAPLGKPLERCRVGLVATAGVTLLEPALILLFGALVGFVALAMLQAIYGINLKAF